MLLYIKKILFGIEQDFLHFNNNNNNNNKFTTEAWRTWRATEKQEINSSGSFGWSNSPLTHQKQKKNGVEGSTETRRTWRATEGYEMKLIKKLRLEQLTP
jgi:hypothetical protein